MVRFSIIIPTYRANRLKWTLDSIVNLRYPHDKFECLVCDNSHGDEILELTKNFTQKASFIKYIRANEKESAYYARNVGAKNSLGEILCFIGDDCIVGEKWLEAMEESFSGSNFSLVKTEIEAGYNNIWDIFMAKKDAFHFEKKYKGDPAGMVFVVDSMAMEKSVFEKLGFFPEGPRAGDVLFSRKFIESGYKLFYLKSPSIKHYGFIDFKDFARKAFAYGFDSIVAKTHGILFTELTFVENLKFSLIEAPKYMGGYRYLFPLCLYALFRMAGRMSAKLKLFSENPIK